MGKPIIYVFLLETIFKQKYNQSEVFQLTLCNLQILLTMLANQRIILIVMLRCHEYKNQNCLHKKGGRMRRLVCVGFILVYSLR